MQERTTAVAIFDDRTQAQRAIEELKRAGFSDREIGVTARDLGRDGNALDTDKGETHAKEGAIAGVTAGAGVGALWGLGILAGVLPAIGPAIAGGTLAALLSSAAAGAATAGIAGALIGLGIPEEEATYYDQEFRAGRVVVTVRGDGRMSEAQRILAQYGGYDVRTGRERAIAESTRRTPGATENVSVGTRTIDDDEPIDTTVRKEHVKVDKRGRNAPRSTPR